MGNGIYTAKMQNSDCRTTCLCCYKCETHG